MRVYHWKKKIDYFRGKNNDSIHKIISMEIHIRHYLIGDIYNVPLVKTQMKKIIVTAKTLYSHPKNVSKIYAALHTDLAW